MPSEDPDHTEWAWDEASKLWRFWSFSEGCYVYENGSREIWRGRQSLPSSRRPKPVEIIIEQAKWPSDVCNHCMEMFNVLDSQPDSNTQLRCQSLNRDEDFPKGSCLWRRTLRDILSERCCTVCKFVSQAINFQVRRDYYHFGSNYRLSWFESTTRSELSDLRLSIPPDRIFLEFSIYHEGKSERVELYTADAESGQFSRKPHTCSRQLVGACPTLKLIADWIRTCETSHRARCQPERNRLLLGGLLWVVDVLGSRISELPLNQSYITLSYVWGLVPADVTTRQNATSRMQPDGLRDVLKSSSKVIRDAVSLVKGIGQRYLWVDQLCIIQDDLSQLQNTLQNMSTIYEDALATVVAATGTDAHSGLPGVTTESRVCNQKAVIIKIGSKKLALVIPLTPIDLTQTTYAERAWT